MRHGADVDAWLHEMRSVRLRGVCAMSTDPYDQALVAQLADDNDAVLPCFGVHPWAAHTISLQNPSPPAREHYAALFRAQDVDVALLDALPTPTPLDEVLAQLRAYLTRYSHALVGEVGIDRSFRLPYPGSAPQRLTRYQTPIEHQLAVLEPQVRLACQLRRSISMHSVRAAGHTTNLLARFAAWEGFCDIGASLGRLCSHRHCAAQLHAESREYPPGAGRCLSPGH